MSRRSLVLHAGRMVGRTLRSYAMLSVTILLSFSFLLGYLVFTDSQLHNSYKDVLHQDRHVVSFTGSGIRDTDKFGVKPGILPPWEKSPFRWRMEAPL